MRLSRSAVITWAAVLLLAAFLPSALREAYESGRIYLFSWEFLADVPRRLTGPGRLRFILQPTVAIVLGVRGGLVDARAGHPAWLYGLLFHGAHRREYLRSALAAVRDLVAIAIILDAVSQYLIFHEVHPGAALIVGPVLIAAPYALARSLANRLASRSAGPAGREPPAPPADGGLRR